MHPIVLIVITGLSAFLAVALIEDKLMPILKEDSKIKKWWRKNIIADYEESDNL
jgi:hypothetical protein